HFRSLDGMRARPDAQIDVRCRNLQLLEEYLGHALIIVLPGMDQTHLDVAAPRDFPHDGSNLHEVRSGTRDNDQPHAARPRVPGPAGRPDARLCSISLSLASQLSCCTRSLIAVWGPGDSNATATCRRNSCRSRPMRHHPKAATSGMSVETTGSPAAKYSR